MEEENPPGVRRSTAAAAYDRTLGAVWRAFHRKIIRPVLTINDSPHSVALGVTLGIWVAFTPTVGIQIPIVLVLGTLIKANRVIAVALTWISNLFTMVPLYYLYYLLGLVVLGRDGITYAELEALMEDQDSSAWDTIVRLLDELGSPLWVGSLIMASVLAPPCYPLCRRWLEKREARREEAEGRDADPVRQTHPGDDT